MSGFGTDVLAVTCILGGAAVSGAATLALMPEKPSEERLCMVEAVPVRPAIVVTTSSNRHGTVVVAPSVTPDVRVRRIESCLSGEVIRIERSRAEMRRELVRTRAEVERVRAEMLRARAEAERARAIPSRAPSADARRMYEQAVEARREAVRALAEAVRAQEEAAARIRR